MDNLRLLTFTAYTFLRIFKILRLILKLKLRIHFDPREPVCSRLLLALNPGLANLT